MMAEPKKWEVQTAIGNGWENVWHEQDDDDTPPRLWRFNSYQEAFDELEEFRRVCALEGIDTDPDDYRIVEVETGDE